MVDVLKREKNNTTVQASRFNDRLTFNKTVWIFFISCEVAGLWRRYGALSATDI